MHRPPPLTMPRLFGAVAVLQLLATAQLRAQNPPSVLSVGACGLSSGAVIPDSRVAYRAFGQFNPDRTNAVLIPSWL